jgi:hypothetical protein
VICKIEMDSGLDRFRDDGNDVIFRVNKLPVTDEELAALVFMKCFPSPRLYEANRVVLSIVEGDAVLPIYVFKNRYGPSGIVKTWEKL